jgi:hypothetical protein
MSKSKAGKKQRKPSKKRVKKASVPVRKGVKTSPLWRSLRKMHIRQHIECVQEVLQSLVYADVSRDCDCPRVKESDPVIRMALMHCNGRLQKALEDFGELVDEDGDRGQ